MYNADAMKRYKSSQIRELAEILKNDGAISVPTDTVYGVCARMDSEKAQEHLRDVKNRPLTKAFPLIRAFMPGPVTLILKKREEVPAYVNGGMETVAVRMATDRQLYELIKETGSPLYMTSANQSGEATCTSLDEIEKACPLLDGMLEGETQFGKASTIIDCTKELPVILREGPVNMEDINEALKEEEHA